METKYRRPSRGPVANVVVEAVRALRNDELSQWKRDNDYQLHSLCETERYRFKQLIGPKLGQRNY